MTVLKKHLLLKCQAIGSAALSLILATPGSLQASCGCASCPIDTVTSEQKSVGIINFDYSYQYSDATEARIGINKASIGQIPGIHDEISTLSEIHTFRLGTALSSRLGVDVYLPFIHREHQHLQHGDVNNNIESWNFDGLGDVSLLTRFVFFKPESHQLPTISLVVGGKFPTGKDNARGISQNDDLTLSNEIAEPGIQPGTGSYDLIAGISEVQSFSLPMVTGDYATMPIFFNITYKWNGKGREDYRLGDTLIGDIGAVYPITRKLGVSGQMNMRFSRQDSAGLTSEQVDRTGGIFFYGSPGLQVKLGENTLTYIHVQIPFYQNVNGIQVVPSYSLIMGISYRFGVL